MSKDNVVKIGSIGLGPRAETLLASIFALPEEVEVAALCDINPVAIEKMRGIFADKQIKFPAVYTDYKQLLQDKNVQAVLIPTSWNSHLQIAKDALAAGKYAGIEVGGASSVEELWQLVHAAETTKVGCMMLENCCYGRNELMALNLARQGLFGELVHCACGYEHDIRYELSGANAMRTEREKHNICRNGDLYPTHGLGPIAKILRINRGNRFLTLTSTASKAVGFTADAEAGGRGRIRYNQGDVVTTVIKCANGETITLTHSVSLPRPYSRDCRVQGTRGLWLEERDGIFIENLSCTEEKIDAAGNPYYEHHWEKTSDYYEKFDHPIWRNNSVIGGHGGMDALALKAFFDAVRTQSQTPIDVYDIAAWMSVTVLSEQSIAMGSMPVAFPDFTNGKWIDRRDNINSVWSLDEVIG
jgi:predicted dehydrogenase